LQKLKWAAGNQNQQRFSLGNGIHLIDYPGSYGTKLENAEQWLSIGRLCSIKDTAMSMMDVGFFTADYLIKSLPWLSQRANFQLSENTQYWNRIF